MSATVPAPPDTLAAAFGHTFARPGLLREAMTHPSAATRADPSYERLEFLGDRVLNLVIAAWLFQRYPKESEGMLARRHTALVRAETLTRVARKIGIGDFIILSPGEEGTGLRERNSVLADALEAAIAALWLDGGETVVRRFIETHWAAFATERPVPSKPAKMALQEWAQGRGLPLPTYCETDRTGPDHAPEFTVVVSVVGQTRQSGTGNTKRAAEEEAARALLERLRSERFDG